MTSALAPDAPAQATHGDVTLARASFAQERIWFLERIHPGTPAYNMPVVLSFKARLDPEALNRAFNDIVMRHEALRTTFLEIAGQPHQVIHLQSVISLHHADLRYLANAARTKRLAEIATEDASRPFDLESGPLIRATAVQIADGDHLLALCLHHIVADGWSIDLLTRELFEAYAARQQGKTPLLPALPIQYADFSDWQRSRASEDAWREGLRYWTDALAGLPPLLQLPTDHPRPTVQSLRGSVQAFIIHPELLARCKDAAVHSNATLFVALLAAWQTFLFRYSGQNEFAVGTPVANRSRSEFENVIGLFINTIALPCRLDGTMTLRALLADLRKQVIDGLTHQGVPFERVVDALTSERNLSAAPIFQTLFVLQTSGTPGPRTVIESQGPGHGAASGNGTAKFDLTLNVLEANEKLFCSLEYSSDLFDPETVARMGVHFRRLLEALVTAVDAPLAAAAMISPEERRQAIFEWNRTETALPVEASLHRHFELQAARQPSSPALRGADAALTYEELERAANGIAARLLDAGVRPGERVAVCMRRTTRLIVSLIGVLKCGAAYVPLDPDYPRARTEHILRDSAAVALLTERALAPRFEWNGIRLILAEDAADVQTSVSIGRSKQDEAYVLYTSGSSGVPKGVRISHGSATAFVSWAAGAFSRSELGAVLASTSICFDLSVFEIFATLCAGGLVVLVRDILDIASANGEISLINTVPSAIQQLLELNLIPSSVQAINLAGEPLAASLVEKLYAHSRAARIVNLYGPTEDTTYSTMFHVPRGHTGVVPIGRPIANRRAYILDTSLEPAPPGVVGEIYLGGAGVAAGYNRLPELTSQRFLADPFIAGCRVFRTGDLARYRQDGSLEFLGRADAQIKLRGYRIELEEIRSALNACPAVSDSLARVIETASGPALIAYVVPENGANLQESGLLENLRQRLPTYMLPARLKFIGKFPLSPNGKIQLALLPPPDEYDPIARSPVRRPGTELEHHIAEAWKNVLGLRDVDVERSFFDLGGHSLLLTQVAARLQPHIGLAVPLREYFEHPTIASLARRMESLAAGAQALFSPINHVSRLSPVPLSFAQEQVWFFDQFAETPALYTIPLTYSIPGRFDLEAFDEALRGLIRRHETLRTRIVSARGAPAQLTGTYSELDVDFYNLESKTPAQQQLAIDKLAAANLSKPFDLGRSPLMRCTVIRNSGRDHIVLLALHHIVFDGWSIQVFTRDLNELYQAACERRPPTLPDLPIQFADYAAWQRAQLEDGQMEAQLAYWRSRLEGAPELVTFPPDRPRPPRQTYAGRAAFFDIDAALKSKLEQIARAHSTTLFAVAAAGFHILLSLHTGLRDVLTGTPVSGRHHAHIENLIGFFVNTVVLRSRIDPDRTFSEIVAAIKQAVLEAFGHQDAPFECVVSQLQPDRNLSYSPIFQVMFSVQNPLAPPVASALAVPSGASNRHAEPLAATITSKCDMTFGLTAQEGGFYGAVEYSTDLYTAATVERIIADYVRLLEFFAADPNMPAASFHISPLHGPLPLQLDDKCETIAPEPRTPERSQAEIEGEIADIWKEVLRRGDIAVHDNFFKIGGNSLLAIQVVVRLKERGIEASPRDLFENSTIASLSEAMAGRLTQPGSARAEPAATGGPSESIDALSDSEVDDLLRQLLHEDSE